MAQSTKPSSSGSSNSKNFGLTVQKTVRRAKEKVLQNIGKADKTSDETFDGLVANFSKQQNAALKLQKELKNYFNAVKAMSTMSANLYSVVGELYEENWPNSDEFRTRSQGVVISWQSYLNHLQEDTINHFTEYCNLFVDLKNKISKRSRKLIDYDGARHTLADLRSSKKPDQTKINKAEDDLKEKQRVFEEINEELNHDLPALYEKRMSMLSMNFTKFFNNDMSFCEEMARTNEHLAKITEKLIRGSFNGDHNSVARANRSIENTVSLEGDTNDLKKQDVKKNVPANEEDEKKWSYVENNYESIEINGQELKSASVHYKPSHDSRKSVESSSTTVVGLGNDIYSEIVRVKSNSEETVKNKTKENSNSSVNIQGRVTSSTASVEAIYANENFEDSSRSSRKINETTLAIRSSSTENSIITKNSNNFNDDQLKNSDDVRSMSSANNSDTRPMSSTLGPFSSDAYEYVSSPSKQNMETISTTNLATVKMEPENAKKAVLDVNYENNLKEQKLDLQQQQYRSSDISSQPIGNIAVSVVREKSEKLSEDEPLYKAPQSREVQVKSIEEKSASLKTKNDEEHYKIPSGYKMSENILYQVKAIHVYEAEDTDELSFEAGEIIGVIPHADPEELDDGWLMGIKIPTGEKGVFPENFTIRLK